MYLFIRDSVYDSKFYFESNAKDFFEKFKNQLILSKYFYEESLKTLAIKYLLNLYSSFEFMKIKIVQDQIDFKLTNEEFTNTKSNLKREYDKEKKTIKEFIDSTIISMKNEYDNFLKEINEGKIKDYEKNLKETSEKIEVHRFNLENKINNEIPNFRKKLLSQLNFIAERLKTISINKGNLSSYGLFQSIDDAECKAFDIMGKGSLGLLVLDLGFLGFSALTTIAAEGVAVAVGEAVGGVFSFSGLASFGIGALIGAAIPACIHFGFKVYKKIVEKDKYIEMIKNAKIELEKSLNSYEENVNSILKKITDEIELAVKKFFTMQNVKLDGIKKHMKDWLLLREQILNCFKN